MSSCAMNEDHDNNNSPALFSRYQKQQRVEENKNQVGWEIKNTGTVRLFEEKLNVGEEKIKNYYHIFSSSSNDSIDRCGTRDKVENGDHYTDKIEKQGGLNLLTENASTKRDTMTVVHKSDIITNAPEHKKLSYSAVLKGIKPNSKLIPGNETKIGATNIQQNIGKELTKNKINLTESGFGKGLIKISSNDLIGKMQTRKPIMISSLCRAKSAKRKSQCIRWSDPTHRHKHCTFWHPRADCRFYPHCHNTAEECRFAHPFCGETCRCSTIDPQKNHPL